MEWAGAAGWSVHVLLAKSDKLNQRERATVLKEAERICGTQATVQVFSAHDGSGVPAAQKRLLEMLASSS
jgi:GTP-binding protein EngB required for normal cell division